MVLETAVKNMENQKYKPVSEMRDSLQLESLN